MEESQTLHGREEYRLYSFYLRRSHHRPIKLNVVRDDYRQLQTFNNYQGNCTIQQLLFEPFWLLILPLLLILFVYLFYQARI
jgi:hypothetical protein